MHNLYFINIHKLLFAIRSHLHLTSILLQSIQQVITAQLMYKKETPEERAQRIHRHRKVLDYIVQLQTDPHELPIPQDKVSLAVHFTFKAIALFLVAFDQLTAKFFQQQYTAQLIIIFIVVQFWITKNYTGKRMLGYWWFFAQDQHGYERLMYECRANKQLVNQMLPKLFYIVQIVYIVVAWLIFFEAIFIIPQTFKVQGRKIRFNLLLMVSGVANLFFFYIISDSVSQSQDRIRRNLGIEELRKMQYASIISHY